MNGLEIEDLIRDYSRIKNELKRLGEKQDSPSFQLGGAAGGSARGIKRMLSYKKKIEKIMRFYEVLEDDKHFVIFDCMLDGMTYTDIAKHLCVSRQTLRKLKNEMINQIIKRGC